jgi:hypothetical protein
MKRCSVSDPQRRKSRSSVMTVELSCFGKNKSKLEHGCFPLINNRALLMGQENNSEGASRWQARGCMQCQQSLNAKHALSLSCHSLQVVNAPKGWLMKAKLAAGRPLSLLLLLCHSKYLLLRLPWLLLLLCDCWRLFQLLLLGVLLQELLPYF